MLVFDAHPATEPREVPMRVLAGIVAGITLTLTARACWRHVLGYALSRGGA